MTPSEVMAWVRGYEEAWRAPGTPNLADLFADDVSYRPSPWAEAIEGLAALERFWEAERQGPDEPFAIQADLVAVDAPVAVVRVAVAYEEEADGRWRDLWVIRFNDEGRCASFEEWPFSPGQDDGHESVVGDDRDGS
jgi:ketosteroid isomerase-like protein